MFDRRCLLLAALLTAVFAANVAQAANALPLDDGTYLARSVACQPGWLTNDYYTIKGNRIDYYERYCKIKSVTQSGKSITVRQTCMIEGSSISMTDKFELLSQTAFNSNHTTYTYCSHEGGF